MENIKVKIRERIKPILQGNEIDDDENFFELGLVHSLFAMQIILFIEKEYKIELDPEEVSLENLSSVNAIAEIIDERLKVNS
ncbi:acyl carrier protein [Tenacibaculum tangerinum]|uniref:Acyl carrier protein n=1 Tax=Tenacibaculum tangerinum TaxID=3038772 RepID=A0ABY8KYB4_9FLAO|nr:acyl carrier protein [Tenacibaculum tangerinum]WGH74231.1 acyl carrier protein [Tenacibaculum tangerinum]